MDTYKLLVGACTVVILFCVLGMMIKKYPKGMILCGIGLLLVIGPVSCHALTK